MSLYC